MNSQRIENIQRLMEQKIEKRKRKKQEIRNNDLKDGSSTSIDICKKKESKKHRDTLFSLLLSLPKGRFLELTETFVNSFEFYLFISPHVINYLIPKQSIKRKANKLIDKLSKVIVFLRLQIILFKILKIFALFKDKTLDDSDSNEQNSNAIELIDKASKHEDDVEIKKVLLEKDQTTTGDTHDIAEINISTKEDCQAKDIDVFEQAWNKSADSNNRDQSEVAEKTIPEILAEDVNEIGDHPVVDKKEQINQLALEIAIELFDLVCLWKNVSFVDMISSMFGKKKPAKSEEHATI